MLLMNIKFIIINGILIGAIQEQRIAIGSTKSW